MAKPTVDISFLSTFRASQSLISVGMKSEGAHGGSLRIPFGPICGKLAIDPFLRSKNVHLVGSIIAGIPGIIRQAVTVEVLFHCDAVLQQFHAEEPDLEAKDLPVFFFLCMNTWNTRSPIVISREIALLILEYVLTHAHACSVGKGTKTTFPAPGSRTAA